MGLAGTYDIRDGGHRIGTLEVIPQGGYLRFRAVCRTEKKGLLRLSALGEAGEADLGSLRPGGSGWFLDRRFSPAALRELGLRSIRGCVLRTALPEGWAEEPDPSRLFREPLLQRLSLEVRGALACPAEEGVLLALPLTSPFPLLPVFCLGTPRRLGGNTYLVFHVFQGKVGMIPPETGQAIPGDPK